MCRVRVIREESQSQHRTSGATLGLKGHFRRAPFHQLLKTARIYALFLLASCALVLVVPSSLSAQDVTPLDLISDAAGLFNERGYLKSNSVSADGSEAINDFNGNLIWSKTLRRVQVAQSGLECNLTLTYNGSVGHIIQNSIDGESCAGRDLQASVNAPEWIIAVNNIAIQTFNFENEFITWANSDDTVDFKATSANVAALINGYHSCYSLHLGAGAGTQWYGVVSILMGDGSVRQFYSVGSTLSSVPSKRFWGITGEYRTLSKDDRARGYIDPANARFTLFEEDGTRVLFDYHKPSWQTAHSSNAGPADSIAQFLPIQFLDQTGHSISISYLPSSYGRPVVASVSNGYAFAWKGLGGLCYTLRLMVDGRTEYTIEYPRDRFVDLPPGGGGGNAPSPLGDINRGYITSIIDAAGRAYKFEYSQYLRVAEGFGQCDYVIPAWDNAEREVARYVRWWMPRLNKITYPHGQQTYFTYCNDGKSKYPPTGSMDELSIDFHKVCDEDEFAAPCKKSARFDDYGRDPYFVNMVAARRRVDSSGATVSIDSMEYGWNEEDSVGIISASDVFWTTKSSASSPALLSSGKKSTFQYQQFATRGPYTKLERDRGWNIRLIARSDFMAPGAEHDWSQLTQNTWETECPSSAFGFNPTLLLKQQHVTRDSTTATTTYSYRFPGNAADRYCDSVNNLLETVEINPVGDSLHTYYVSDFWSISNGSSYYTNVLVSKREIRSGSTLLSRNTYSYFPANAATGYRGQLQRSTRYVIQEGVVSDSLSEVMSYVTDSTPAETRVRHKGSLRKLVSPAGDSAVFHYDERVPNPPGYRNLTGSEPVSNPVMFKVLRADDSVIAPWGQQMFNTGPSWYKLDVFTNGRHRVPGTYDTSYVYHGDLRTVYARQTWEGEKIVSDTIRVPQDSIECQLALSSGGTGGHQGHCVTGSYALIRRNGITQDSIACQATTQEKTFRVPVAVGDVITAHVKHVGEYGGTFYAHFKHYITPHWIDTITHLDSIPATVTYYQDVDSEGKLKRVFNPNGFMSEVAYDPIDRASRIVLPGNFSRSWPEYYYKYDTMKLYPSSNGNFNPPQPPHCEDSILTLRDTIDCRYIGPRWWCESNGAYPSILFRDGYFGEIDVDSAFLNLHCTLIVRDTGPEPEGSSMSVYVRRLWPDSTSCIVQANQNVSPDASFNIDVGWNRVSIPGAVIERWSFPDSSTPGVALILNRNSPCRAAVASSLHPDTTLWPYLEVYGKRYTSPDSLFTRRYICDDRLTDGDGIDVSTRTRAQYGVSVRSQRARIDYLGRVFQVDAQDSITSSYDSTLTRYDFADRRVYQIDQLGDTTKHAYDRTDRLVKTNFPDSLKRPRDSIMASYGRGHARDFAFPDGFRIPDSQLVLTRSTDENGKVTIEGNDILGRLRVRQVTNGSTPYRTFFDYDGLGNLTKVVRPMGDTVRYWYNSLGQLVKECASDYDSILYQYNRNGLLAAVQDGHIRTTYGTKWWRYTIYDGAKRKKQEGLQIIDVTTQYFPIIEYFYDQMNCQYSQGKLSVSYNNVDRFGERYDYDPRGRIVTHTLYFNADFVGSIIDSVQMANLRGDSLTVRYAYNYADQITRITYPSGQVVTYDYDQRGRLKSVGDSISLTKFSQLGYSKRDELESLNLGVGLQTVNYAYNSRGWLNTINNGIATGGDLFGERLYYYGGFGAAGMASTYRNGNICGQTIQMGTEAASVYRYTYDDLDRLLTRDRKAGGALWYGDEVFQYDPNGNQTLRKRPGPLGTPSADSISLFYTPGTNRLTQVWGTSYGAFTFDPSGNLAQDERRGSQYFYDLFGQLDSAVVVDPGEPSDVLQFKYNSAGERVWKQFFYHYYGECLPPPDPGDTIYPNIITPPPGDSGWIEGEGMMQSSSGGGGDQCLRTAITNTYYLVSQGKVLAEYSSLANPPEFTYIYAGDQRIACRDKTGKLFFYLNDHLGSARVVVDTTGIVKDKYRYQSYGADDGQTLSTNQPRRYTGQTWDGDGTFDLYYYGRRYYDPTLGRFTQLDPILSDASQAPYIYSRDNPITFLDPDGQAAIPHQYTMRGIADGIWNGLMNRASEAKRDAANVIRTSVVAPNSANAQVVGGVATALTPTGNPIAAVLFQQAAIHSSIALFGELLATALDPTTTDYRALGLKIVKTVVKQGVAYYYVIDNSGRAAWYVIGAFGTLVELSYQEAKDRGLDDEDQEENKPNPEPDPNPKPEPNPEPNPPPPPKPEPKPAPTP